MRLIDCHAKRDDDYDWGDNSRDPTCERRGVVSHDRRGSWFRRTLRQLMMRHL